VRFRSAPRVPGGQQIIDIRGRKAFLPARQFNISCEGVFRQEMDFRRARARSGDERAMLAEFGSSRLQKLSPCGKHNRKDGDADGRSGRHSHRFTQAIPTQTRCVFPRSSSGVRVSKQQAARMAAMDGKASPRNPSVAIESRSSAGAKLRSGVALEGSSESSWFMPEAVVDTANHALAA